MYQEIIDLIVKLGDTLPPLSGRMVDIGVKKEYLTEKDLEIEQALTDFIHALPGDHQVYAEELSEDWKEAENVWAIDPISGTKTFLRGWHHYSVVVSHMINGEVQFAAVYDPSVQELFSAQRGKGAFLNGEPIHVSQRTEKFYAILNGAKESPLPDQNLTKLYEALRKLGSVKTIGSMGCQYAYIACGRADVALMQNKDTFPEFAGSLLIEEAGGIMTDFEGNRIGPEPNGVIACRSDLHSQVLEIVQEINK